MFSLPLQSRSRALLSSSEEISRVHVECSIKFVANSSSVSSWMSKNHESLDTGWCNSGMEMGSSLDEEAVTLRSRGL